MSNHTGKLIVGGWRKLRWWFVDVFGSEYPTRPLASPPEASDMVTKQYVDAQSLRQNPEDVIPGEQSMEGPNRYSNNVIMGKIVLDDAEIALLAEKIGQILAKDLKMAQIDQKSPTKRKIEGRRAENVQKLKNQARNQQFVASEDENEPKTPEEALEFVKKKLDEAGIPEIELKESGECPSCHWKPASEGGLPCRSCVEQEKSLELPQNDVLEGPNCSEYPDCDGNCCEKADSEAK